MGSLKLDAPKRLDCHWKTIFWYDFLGSFCNFSPGRNYIRPPPLPPFLAKRHFPVEDFEAPRGRNLYAPPFYTPPTPRRVFSGVGGVRVYKIRPRIFCSGAAARVLPPLPSRGNAQKERSSQLLNCLDRPRTTLGFSPPLDAREPLTRGIPQSRNSQAEESLGRGLLWLSL